MDRFLSIIKILFTIGALIILGCFFFPAIKNYQNTLIALEDQEQAEIISIRMSELEDVLYDELYDMYGVSFSIPSFSVVDGVDGLYYGIALVANTQETYLFYIDEDENIYAEYSFKQANEELNDIIVNYTDSYVYAMFSYSDPVNTYNNNISLSELLSKNDVKISIFVFMEDGDKSTVELCSYIESLGLEAIIYECTISDETSSQISACEKDLTGVSFTYLISMASDFNQTYCKPY